MAKKKNLGKKHRFKHAEPSAASSGVRENSPAQATVAAPAKQRSFGSGVVVERDFSYVAVDLRRIGIMATGFLCLQLILWFVFGHTGAGDAIYRLVQV